MNKNALSTNEKIAKLEDQILKARELLSRLPPGRGAGLVLSIQKMERKLAIHRSHQVSKYDTIKRRVVSGSYGTGRRTN